MSTSNTSSSEESSGPEIPNYEVFRTIGKGGYGEVWLARSITGAFRAVKVVRRTNFESDRAFEREFEGIQRYETVSQDHHGLVDILHVGRDDEQGFYYYVMELADDVEKGRDIEPDTYVPLTLASKLKAGKKMPLKECLEVGGNLSEGLGQLHSHKLTHRDVKPSNIIYIRDRPTLADPGLVALSGQNTFVGTEGYVPPEGPGKPQADLYSLGVVLYEMNTGKDRLEFPELPTIVDRSEADFEERNALNTIICNACAPRPSQRYQNATDFHEALASIGRDTKHDLIWGQIPAKLTAALAILFACGMFALVFRGGPEPKPNPDPELAGQTPPPTELPGDHLPSDPDTTPKEEMGPQVVVEADPVPEAAGEENGGQETSNSNNEDPALVATNTGEPSPEAVPGDDPPPDGTATPVEEPQPEEDPEMTAERQPELVPPPKAQYGTLRINSFPPKARVFLDGEQAGLTPLILRNLEAREYEVRFELENYEDTVRKAQVVGDESRVLYAELPLWSPPLPGQSWENSLGMSFLATGPESGHRSTEPLRAPDFEIFAKEFGRDNLNYQIGLQQLVFADGRARFEFCQWLTERDRDRGYLTNSLVYMQETAEPLDGSPDLATFYAVVDTQKTGRISITSDPPRAGVYRMNGEKLGKTPLELKECALGPVSFRLRKAGYGAVTLDGTVDHLEPLELGGILTPNRSVIFGYPWDNSLEMRMVPVRGLMVSAYETRLQDYEAFWETEDNPERYFEPEFPQGDTHPVVNVRLEDAQNFCAWLTKKERELELIQPNQRYRLPTDREWSLMAGLPEEKGSTPEERDGSVKGVYPWGKEWPPPNASGNFADSTAALVLDETIEDYEDGYVRTAPVGSFEPNLHGLYDVTGNVWEWIGEPYSADPKSNYVAMRGGSWQDASKDLLLSSTRNVTSPRNRFVNWGFRVVLVEEAEPHE